MTTKICSKCKIEKSLLLFNNSSKTKDGKYTICRDCVAISAKKYREATKEELKIKKSKYYFENKDLIREKARINKDRINEVAKIYRKNNLERIRQREKEYKKRNQENTTRYRRTYYLKNKEKFRNRAKFRKFIKRQLNKGKDNFYEFNDFIHNLKNKNKLCYWCDCKIVDNNYHIDHYIPLSKGGTNNVDNLVISCPNCNLTKSNKDPVVFANSIGKLF